MSITKRIALGVIMFLGVMFGASAMNVSTAPSAYAADCPANSINACINFGISFVGGNGGGQVGVGGPPSGGGGGGSSPSVPAPQIPCLYWSEVYKIKLNSSGGWSNFPGGCIPSYKTDVHQTWSASGNYPPCAVKTINGFKIKPSGRLSIDKFQPVFGDYNGDPKIKWAKVSTSLICMYPKAHSDVRVIRCPLSGSSQIVREANSARGYKVMNSKSVTLTSVSKIVNSGKECQFTLNIPVTASVKNAKDSWGQYTAKAQIKYVQCRIMTTSFNGSSTKVYDCGGVKSIDASQKKTMWCAGVSNGHVNKKWTAADCGEGGTGKYKCTVPPATFNGKSGTVQTIRDGKNRIVKWGNPKLTGGVRSAKNWESKTVVFAGSTPSNPSLSIHNNGNQQYFNTDISLGSWKARNTNQNIRFYNASNPGGNFRLQQNTRFDAQFLVKNSSITGASYNAQSNSLTTTTKSVDYWQADTDILCDVAKNSPRIQVVRSIGAAF